MASKQGKIRIKQELGNRRAEDRGVTISLNVQFDPQTIDPQRQSQIWAGVAMVMKGAMTQEELDAFMAEFQRQARAASEKTSHASDGGR